jgi:hypothetical protein
MLGVVEQRIEEQRNANSFVREQSGFDHFYEIFSKTAHVLLSEKSKKKKNQKNGKR